MLFDASLRVHLGWRWYRSYSHGDTCRIKLVRLQLESNGLLRQSLEGQHRNRHYAERWRRIQFQWNHNLPQFRPFYYVFFHTEFRHRLHQCSDHSRRRKSQCPDSELRGHTQRCGRKAFEFRDRDEWGQRIHIVSDNHFWNRQRRRDFTHWYGDTGTCCE